MSIHFFAFNQQLFQYVDWKVIDNKIKEKLVDILLQKTKVENVLTDIISLKMRECVRWWRWRRWLISVSAVSVDLAPFAGPIKQWFSVFHVKVFKITFHFETPWILQKIKIKIKSITEFRIPEKKTLIVKLNVKGVQVAYTLSREMSETPKNKTGYIICELVKNKRPKLEVPTLRANRIALSSFE